MKRISPVPGRKELQALRHLVCGSDDESGYDARVESLRMLLRATPRKRKWLWWTRNSEGKIQGVAMVLVSKGAVAFLYHTPADGLRVDSDRLVDLIREISLYALTRGYCMVQRFVPENQHSDASVLLAAGFEKLVELVYMVTSLRGQSGQNLTTTACDDYEFVNYENFRNGELETTIQRTYHGSMDCPRLIGVRSMSDVINSHKTTGGFTPQWWWILRYKGQPVGCVLVNRTANKDEGEIIYLGVIPEFRGKALGKLMLKYVTANLYRAGIKRLILAVDCENTVAINLYECFGFRRTFSRHAYAMFEKSNQ